jgi:hypothetical protein
MAMDAPENRGAHIESVQEYRSPARGTRDTSDWKFRILFQLPFRSMGFKVWCSASFVEANESDDGQENAIMDWIEQIFHVDPDAGNGSLELLFIVCPIAALVLGVVWLFWMRSRRRKRDDRD